MASTYASTVNAFYLAYYGRPADPAGLAFWTQQLEKVGGNFNEIVKSFANSAEATARFGNVTIEQRINQIYQDLFDRAPDATGLQFWLGEIQSGKRTVADMAIAVLQGAVGTDLQLINQRQKAAEAFTSQLQSQNIKYDGLTAAETARLLMQSVTKDTTDADLQALVSASTKLANLASTNPAVIQAITGTGSLVTVLDSLGNKYSPLSLTNLVLSLATSANGNAANLSGLLKGSDLAGLIKVLPAGTTLDAVTKGLTDGGVSGGISVVYPTTPTNPTNPTTPTTDLPTFSAKNTAGAVTYEGTATGDITFTVSSAGVLTFQRAGVTATTTVALADLTGSTPTVKMSQNASDLSVADTIKLTNTASLDLNGKTYSIRDSAANIDAASATVLNGATGVNSTATTGDDSIDLSNNPNGPVTVAVTLNLLAGNDVAVGGNGADTLNGGDGNDNLTGGAGADTLNGGNGDDVLVGAQDDTLLDGGAHTVKDILQVGANFDDVSNAQIVNIEEVALTANNLTVNLGDQTEGLTITGFAIGASTIVGGSGNDTITGGIGNDTLTGGAGADSISGGIGDDTIVGAQDDLLLDGGSNMIEDVLQVGANFDDANNAQIVNIEKVALTATGLTLNLGDQSEGFTITGFAGGASTIVGGSGADTITGGTGADSLTGGAGDDIINGSQEDTLLDGGAHGTKDILRLAASFNNINDAQIAGIEEVILTSGGLNVNLGNQTEGFTITGFAIGASTIVGGSGADTITGGTGADTLTGGAGADSISGGIGDDIIVGAQDDTLLDGGAQTLKDILEVGTNFDDVNNAQIVNIEEVNLTATGLTLNLGDQTEDFTINGSAGIDTITGGSGNDRIVGNAGADILSGGDGNDRFVFDAGSGALGADTSVAGGNGTDIVDVWNGVGAVTINDGHFANFTGMETLTMASVGTGLTNSATLGANASAAFANGITVQIEAGDLLSLNASAVTVAVTATGHNGIDTITTGSGNDIIEGDDGVDALTGGAGNDTYVYREDADVGIGESITELAAGGTDTIRTYGSVSFTNLSSTSLFHVEQILLATGSTATFNGAMLSATPFKINEVSEGATTLSISVAASSSVNVSQLLFTSFDGNTAFGTNDSILITAAAGNTNENITGTSLADTINAGDGADTIDGGNGADIITGGAGADIINGGAGADRYVLANDAIDQIASAGFTTGAGGDVLDFSALGLGGSAVVTNSAYNLYDPDFHKIGVQTTDAVGNAAALKTLLDGNANWDNGFVGTRAVVWEIDANNVGIALVTSPADALDNDNVTVTQIATLVGFADQAAVDAFTSSLVASNFL